MFISSSDMNDSTIKLFGNTISLKETHFPISSTLSVEKSDQDCQSSVVDSQVKNGCIEEIEEEDTSVAEKCGKSNKSSMCGAGKEDNRQMSIIDNKPEGSEPETDTISEEKVLKKPDKIIPCPRCNSLETKFCYYNNYNVSQPRHFCKKCQRYWTAGGTMRNVPVGAGRRKTTKHFDSQHRQLIVSATEDPMSWGSSGLSRPMRGSETIPKFALGTPDFKEKCLSSDKLKQENKIGSLVCVDDGEEPSSCGSSITASSCRENELPGNAANIEKGSMPGSCNGLSPTHPLQLYPGLPWPYSWNSGWNNVVPVTVVGQCSPEMIYGAENGISRPVEWLPSSPAFCPQAIAFPFASPPTYWPCMPDWSVGAFHVQWVGPSTSSCTSPTSSTTNSGYSGNISPCLGKHPRDSNPEEDKLEKCFWVPKTRRISDRDDKAENSIWTTLGIKRNQNEPITEGGIFKAFEPKIQGHAHTLDARQILRANPAAFCRSQSFQEST